MRVVHNADWFNLCLRGSWDKQSATVACRNLGYPDALEATTYPLPSGGGGGGEEGCLFDMKDIVCRGDEYTLASCMYQDVGAVGSSEEIDLQLVGMTCQKKGTLDIF